MDDVLNLQCELFQPITSTCMWSFG